MNIKHRFAVVKAIAELQRSWTSIAFTKYGSLYFSEDLENVSPQGPLYVDGNGNKTTNVRYAIGPSTGRENFDNERATVNFDRGPCNIASLNI